MAGKDQAFLRGVDMWKGDYFKRKGENKNSNGYTPIHFLPKSEKTDDWKAAVSDYYEYIGLAKVSNNYDEIIKNRWLSSGIIDINDYRRDKVSKNFEAFQHAGIDYSTKKNNINEEEDDEDNDVMFDFYPLIPNLVNLFTGYQLKRPNKFVFSLVDEFSKAALFEKKDNDFKAKLKEVMLEMRDNALNGEDPNEQKAQEDLINAQLKFKNYKDVGVEWANRVHKINYNKHNIRNLIKQAFKESYLNSSKVIFHLNMLPDRFITEHIDEAFAFHGPVPNSVYLTDSDYIGWFKWMNVGDLLNNFGKILSDEDIKKLKDINTAISSNNLDLIPFWNQHPSDSTGYNTTKPYNQQANEPLDISRYKQEIRNSTGFEFNNQTVFQHGHNINPDFTYGEDRLYRVMYLYLKSQKRIGWLTKINRTGQIEFQDWIDENFIVTEKPVYDNSKKKEKSAENLVYGEHIDWEWISDWRRFITISPNQFNASYNQLGANLEKIYIDGNSLPFQFKNDKTPYGVKPPIAAIEIKQRGVRAVPVVSLLKQDQVIYNICKNRVKKAIANDRGLMLVYPTNLVSRMDASDEDDGEIIDRYERSLAENKTMRLTYDKQYLQGAGGQMGTPSVLNLSTLDEALKYDNLAERIWYNALRTVGVTPQAMGEIKASEEVSNANAAQQISQVQTELIYDEFNTRLIPELYQRMLEATQYYSVINEDFKLIYLNDNDENTWLDITGVDLLHKDFSCEAKYSFDNEEFTGLVKKLAFDNTLQESVLTRLKMIANADENVTKVLTMLEESEQKAMENAQKAEEARRADMKAQQDHEKAMLDAELENINTQKELDRQSKEHIAELGILGTGLQTDNNANMQNDSLENFRYILQQKKLEQEKLKSSELFNLQQKMHQDQVNLKREELLQKDRSDDKKLKAAVANRNKSSSMEIDKAALKK